MRYKLNFQKGVNLHRLAPLKNTIKEIIVMGRKYCPECREVVETKALPNYTQIEFRGILVKKREIAHLKEDGGCGYRWFTVELPEDILTWPG